jgi:enoyl-CoA hydratase/carnithine racemase
LTIDRPDVRNAMSYEMWAGLAAACDALAGEDDVRVLVVTGAGGHFCAGADIGGLAADPAALMAVNHRAEQALAQFPKPTIAFVSGACVGGGCEIAIACDLRIADRTARFGITPARLGALYPEFALERLVGLVGSSSAKYLLFSGELVDADAALRLGLVNEVHDPGPARARLGALTETLAHRRSQLSLQGTKAMIDAAAGGGIPAALAQRWFDEMADGPDMKEGIAAFGEGRDPQFSWTRPLTITER